MLAEESDEAHKRAYADLVADSRLTGSPANAKHAAASAPETDALIAHHR